MVAAVGLQPIQNAPFDQKGSRISRITSSVRNCVRVIAQKVQNIWNRAILNIKNGLKQFGSKLHQVFDYITAAPYRWVIVHLTEDKRKLSTDLSAAQSEIRILRSEKTDLANEKGDLEVNNRALVGLNDLLNSKCRDLETWNVWSARDCERIQERLNLAERQIVLERQRNQNLSVQINTVGPKVDLIQTLLDSEKEQNQSLKAKIDTIDRERNLLMQLSAILLRFCIYSNQQQVPQLSKSFYWPEN